MMNRNIIHLVLVVLYLTSSQSFQINAFGPIDLLEETFEAIPNFAENYITKPLVIEKEGIDDDGNEYYEKDIIMGSGFQGGAFAPRPLPVLPPARLMEALRNEQRSLLNSNMRLVESQLPRVMSMLNAERGRLFTSSNNDIMSNLLPRIQMGRQHIARLPFDEEAQVEEILWGKPTLRAKPAFGVIMSTAKNTAEPVVGEPNDFKRLEDNLNNAQKEFINNLHHAQEADSRPQAAGKNELIDEISQFFNDYDQKARLSHLEQQQQRPQPQPEMDKKSIESGDMAADIDVVDASYIFIEVDKNINKHEVEVLLKSVSNITQIPTEYIDDINISKGLVFFKITKPNINTSKYVNIITNSIDKIQQSTGLKIVSCGLGNRESHVEVSKQKYIDSNSENFLLVTIIICATVACVLLSLLVIFLIRRRAHLRNKLVGDVSISGGKAGNFNDEERLITDECKSRGSSFSFWPFNKLGKQDTMKGELASPSQNYQDLCRSRMQGKATPQGPNAASNDSTPSIVPNSANRVQSTGSDGKTESSRSSTSS